MTEAECEAIRPSVRRNRPYASESWTPSTAARLGLLFSLGSRGNQGAVNPEIASNPWSTGSNWNALVVPIRTLAVMQKTKNNG
jgi:hypothetical protein